MIWLSSCYQTTVARVIILQTIDQVTHPVCPDNVKQSRILDKLTSPQNICISPFYSTQVLKGLWKVSRQVMDYGARGYGARSCEFDSQWCCILQSLEKLTLIFSLARNLWLSCLVIPTWILGSLSWLQWKIVGWLGFQVYVVRAMPPG